MCKKFPYLVVGDAICDFCRLQISNIRKEGTEEDYAPESTEDVNVSNLY